MDNNKIVVIIPSSLSNLAFLRSMLRSYLELNQVNSESIVQIIAVADELSTNAIEHGYIYKKDDVILLSIERVEGNLILTVEDNGKGFDEEKNSKENGGLGLRLVKEIADDFKIEKKENGTIFRVEKSIREVN